ncbi:MAG: hypothetical protein COA69_12430 [Robiginitomaculum sp.]|nr:MAG: hypothetical protein COA69_12430 [Robiginitomaculum sp.]
MRFAICALSAALLSGCGYGSQNVNSYGFSNTGAAYGCNNTAQYGYAQQGGYVSNGCGAVGGYTQATNGYSAYGYAAGGAGLGLRGAQQGQAYNMGAQNMGVYGQSMGYPTTMGYSAGASAGASAYSSAASGMYGAGSMASSSASASASASAYGTVLNGSAPYGAAIGGQYAGGQYAANQYAGGQYASGHWEAGAGATQIVNGAPIYIPQPYPAYYYAGGGAGNACCELRGGSVALPFGLEVGIGTEFYIGGDIVGEKPAGPAKGGCGCEDDVPLNVSSTPTISYADAYKNAVNFDLAATYDITPSTLVLARLGYSKAEGNRIRTGTIDDGTLTEDLYAQWGDLEQFTVEGGVRKYMGGWNNSMSGFRPYFAATAGFAHNNTVNLSQYSATLMPEGANVQTYLHAGWTPTASAVLGAEMQIGPRTALGVEAGLRWRDDLYSIQPQSDRWSVPVKLRARVSF